MFPSPVVKEEILYLIGREVILDHWMKTDSVSKHSVYKIYQDNGQCAPHYSQNFKIFLPLSNWYISLLINKLISCGVH